MVNSWNGWDPLKQIIVGSTLDPEYFEIFSYLCHTFFL